jgi:hypothetical protein
VGLAGARVPETPFPPGSTMRRARMRVARARVHPRTPMRTKLQGGTLVLAMPQKGPQKCSVEGLRDFWLLIDAGKIENRKTLFSPAVCTLNCILN